MGISRYKREYSASRSVGFVIPLLALIFVAVLFVLAARAQQSGASFILVSVAAGLVIYWVRELYKMSQPGEQKMVPESERRDWVYDLIKNDKETVFVAEVPGPEDQINVRLTSGVLRITGGQNFTKDVQLGFSTEMGISDYKYRNGVLTIRMQEI